MLGNFMRKAYTSGNEVRIPVAYYMEVMHNYNTCIFPSEIKAGLYYDPDSAEFVLYVPLRVVKENAKSIAHYDEVFS